MESGWVGMSGERRVEASDFWVGSGVRGAVTPQTTFLNFTFHLPNFTREWKAEHGNMPASSFSVCRFEDTVNLQFFFKGGQSYRDRGSIL